MNLQERIRKVLREEISNNNIKILTLYHGTCLHNGEYLLNNGWEPMKTKSGGNLGNPRYLYLSSEPEDALWFAQEKGCDNVLKVKNIPIDFLRPDPEDESGYSMKELLSRMFNTGFPSKFILTKPLSSSHFYTYKMKPKTN